MTLATLLALKMSWRYHPPNARYLSMEGRGAGVRESLDEFRKPVPPIRSSVDQHS
jgi:hypothetical protein